MAEKKKAEQPEAGIFVPVDGSRPVDEVLVQIAEAIRKESEIRSPLVLDLKSLVIQGTAGDQPGIKVSGIYRDPE